MARLSAGFRGREIMRLRNVAAFLAKSDPAAMAAPPAARDGNGSQSQPAGNPAERSPAR
jgi:hypothetical protein